MAGGIDIHSHIAGANVNTARLLLPELHAPAHRRRRRRSPTRLVDLSDRLLYAAMGFTTVVEPAISPHQCAAGASRARGHPDHRQGDSGHARQRRFPARPDARRRRPRARSRDYVAWTLRRRRAIGIKVHQRRRRRGVQGQRARLRPGRRGAVLRRHQSRAIVKALADRRRTTSACRIRCICIATISACPAMSRPRWRRSRRPSDTAAASGPSAVLCLWHGGPARLFLRRAAARRGGQRGEATSPSTSAR